MGYALGCVLPTQAQVCIPFILHTKESNDYSRQCGSNTNVLWPREVHMRFCFHGIEPATLPDKPMLLNQNISIIDSYTNLGWSLFRAILRRLQVLSPKMRAEHSCLYAAILKHSSGSEIPELLHSASPSWKRRLGTFSTGRASYIAQRCFSMTPRTMSTNKAATSHLIWSLSN